MRTKLVGLVSALALGLGVSVVMACPEAKKAENAKKSPCAHAAKSTAAQADDGRSETAEEKQPCNKAKLTADKKKPCSKSKEAALVADKDKPCSKSAKAVADKDKPCSKSAKTVADKDKPCSKSKGAALVADKDKPCSKGAKTVADKPCDKPCGKAKLTADKKGDCPIGKKVQAVLTSLPKMTYQVGDEKTCCAKTAEKMAEEAGTKIAYVVGDETFEDKGEATVRLAALIEGEAAEMQAVQFVAGGKCHKCPVAAKSVAKSTDSKIKYRVGGVDFDSKADAEKVAQLVKDAVAEVGMAYKVGDKTYKCGKTAGAKEKENGAKLTYVVGDEETGCKVTAKLKLAEAKVQKIVETAVVNSLSM